MGESAGKDALRFLAAVVCSVWVISVECPSCLSSPSKSSLQEIKGIHEEVSSVL